MEVALNLAEHVNLEHLIASTGISIVYSISPQHKQSKVVKMLDWMRKLAKIADKNPWSVVFAVLPTMDQESTRLYRNCLEENEVPAIQNPMNSRSLDKWVMEKITIMRVAKEQYFVEEFAGIDLALTSTPVGGATNSPMISGWTEDQAVEDDDKENGGAATDKVTEDDQVSTPVNWILNHQNPPLAPKAENKRKLAMKDDKHYHLNKKKLNLSNLDSTNGSPRLELDVSELLTDSVVQNLNESLESYTDYMDCSDKNL